MPPYADEDDDEPTIRMRRRPLPPRRRWLLVLLVLGCLVSAGIGGFAGWLMLRPTAVPSHTASAPSPAAPSAPPSAPTPARAPSFAIGSGDEASILAAPAATLQIFRFAPAPHILVLSFPSLGEQGRMLDRLGAFVEKSGLPRDRLLTDSELDSAIRAGGDTPETYYYGHDYRASDLARFFADADRDGIALNPDEQRLRALLTQEGLLAPGAVGAIISIPPETTAPLIDASSRYTILHHELSHGLYFTDAAYAAYAHAFWSNVLTDEQRAGFRRFLGSESYDKANEDLMLNETQAYLIHTPDPRYFRPSLAGLTDAEAARLREIFVTSMPAGWLKDLTPVSHAPQPP